MEFRHEPVLFEQCMEGLAIRPQGVYVDGTLGGGGHSAGICRRLAGQASKAGRDTAAGTLIGIDRDRDALAAAEQRLREFSCRKYFVQNNYANIRDVLAELEIPGIDGALLDLGVSSFQLDNPDRGFSYMHDAPLDMRMDRSSEITAYDVVNKWSEEELIRIFLIAE